jgi:hypothetical protein
MHIWQGLGFRNVLRNSALQALGTEPPLYQVTLSAAGASKTLTLGTASAPVKWA